MCASITKSISPACEKYHVRILWEPWQGGPNVATEPAGYEALFKAFGNSAFVGLQYDPSHLVWQMMDPIQTARDFVDKIYDVHLKDTEIRWPILRHGGIHPVDDAEWWRFRLPGLGSIDWPAFFTVLQDVGLPGRHERGARRRSLRPAGRRGRFHRRLQDGLPHGTPLFTAIRSGLDVEPGFHRRLGRWRYVRILL